MENLKNTTRPWCLCSGGNPPPPPTHLHQQTWYPNDKNPDDTDTPTLPNYPSTFMIKLPMMIPKFVILLASQT